MAQRQRRTSAWQTTKNAGNMMADGLGRWLGVKGDEEELMFRQHQYQHTKATETLRKNRGLTSGQAANLDAIDSDSDVDDDFDPDKADFETTRDVNEGLQHYRWLHDEELKKIVKPGWFGGEVNRRRASVKGIGFGEQDNGEKEKHRRQSRFASDTLVQAQLKALPEYRPIFFEILTLIQFLALIFMLAHAHTTESLADMGFSNKIETCTADTSPPCVLFNGSINIGATRTISRNPGFGPTTSYLLSIGGKFSPCMREEESYIVRANTEYAAECGPDRNNPCEVEDAGYGCCTLSTGEAGMTTKAQCAADDPFSTWTSAKCVQNTDFIVLRPCCGAPSMGQCSIMTEDHCSFSGGVWMKDNILCSEVLCLQFVCQMARDGYEIEADPTQPNRPLEPNQWFRFITPLMFQPGALQGILVLYIQFHFGRQMEKHAGVLRSFLIYMISGIGGIAIAGIFAPEQVTVGPNSAVFGILGVHLVELFQSWQLVLSPWLSLLKLGGMVGLFLIVGTTNYVDNWSHVGGLCFGIVCAIIFIPYITFGKWDLARKRLLVLICIPLMLIMMISAFVTFYQIQTTSFCSWCHYLNCIPWQDGMCQDELVGSE